jgi:hypothetical protein
MAANNLARAVSSWVTVFINPEVKEQA